MPISHTLLLATTGNSAADLDLPDYTAYATRTLVVLLAFVVVAGALVIITRRLRRGAHHLDHAGSIKIESERQLEPGRRLYIVEIEGTRSLIASDQSGVSLVRSLPPKGPPARESRISERLCETENAGERPTVKGDR